MRNLIRVLPQKRNKISETEHAATGNGGVTLDSEAEVERTHGRIINGCFTVSQNGPRHWRGSLTHSVDLNDRLPRGKYLHFEDASFYVQMKGRLIEIGYLLRSLPFPLHLGTGFCDVVW